jgi:hypothetical protein
VGGWMNGWMDGWMDIDIKLVVYYLSYSLRERKIIFYV